jgi:pimeloyl-ACP methyl ester carboxylesterase
MSATTEALKPPSKTLLFMEWRALHELGAFAAAWPLLRLAPRGDGQPVLVIPGLVASDVSTRPLRAFLKSHGYPVHGWGLGRNFGLRPGVQDNMMARLDELYRRYDRKISLVGWSLGGVYARQLAKLMPQQVRQVITLGSPFAGHPRATNAWRIYELASGQRVDQRDLQFGGRIEEPPPVPTTAVYSRTDGVCAWQCCVEKEAPQAENIEVEGSHCGLGHHPAAVYAVADRLAQPETDWQPFDRSGWRSAFYPDPRRPA